MPKYKQDDILCFYHNNEKNTAVFQQPGFKACDTIVRANY